MFEQNRFNYYTEEKLTAWATELRYFRVIRAYGGHATDYDSLELVLTYTDQKDLLLLEDRLGLMFSVATDKQPKSGDMEGALRAELPAQPSIAGVPVCVTCYAGRVTLAILPPTYEVTPQDVELAQRIEAIVQQVAERIIDPPQDHAYCFCPKYYPDYFNTPKCPCLTAPQRFDHYEAIRSVGTDETNGRYGEVTIKRCKRCDRQWLHYQLENEAFSGSGRYFMGLIQPDLASTLPAHLAVNYLSQLDWLLYGESYFGKAGRASGALASTI